MPPRLPKCYILNDTMEYKGIKGTKGAKGTKGTKGAKGAKRAWRSPREDFSLNRSQTRKETM